MPITELETIAEEFAKDNKVDLLDSVREDEVLNSKGVRYVRKAEVDRGISLQYSKDHIKKEDKNVLFLESLTLESNDYFMNINGFPNKTRDDMKYVVDISPKRIVNGIYSVREICGCWSDFEKPIRIAIPDVQEGPDALRQLIKSIFK